MKIKLIFLLTLVSLILLIDNAQALTNVSQCGTPLNSSNEYYTLNNSITNETLASDCFTVSAQNVTLDCQGNSFYSPAAFDFLQTNQFNTSVINCRVNMTDISNYAIRGSSGSTFGKFFHNIFNGLGISRGAISLVGSDHNILNNTFLNYSVDPASVSVAVSLSSTVLRISIENNTIHNSYRAITSTGSMTYGIVRGNNLSDNQVDGWNSVSAKNITFDSNECARLVHCISMVTTNNNTIINNKFLDSGYGTYYLYGWDTNVSGNQFKNNLYIDIENHLVETQYFTNNNFSHNLISNSLLNFSTTNGNLNELILFNLTMKYINNTICPGCVYSAKIYPSETSFTHRNNGGVVEGNFTPTRSGIYSILWEVNDSLGNKEQRISSVLVNATQQDNVAYYFRDYTSPIGNGRPQINRDDIGFLLTPPTSDEEIYCTTVTQAEPAVMPTPYLFPIITDVNITQWTNLSTSAPFIGLLREWIYGGIPTINTTVQNGSYVRQDVNFSFLDWAYTDYAKSIVMFSVVTRQPGLTTGMSVYTNPTNQSITNLTYNYASTPAITSFDFNNAYLLGATMNENYSNGNLTVRVQNAPVNIGIKMPVSNSYSVYLNGEIYSSSESGTFTITITSDGDNDIGLSLNPESSTITDEQELCNNLIPAYGSFFSQYPAIFALFALVIGIAIISIIVMVVMLIADGTFSGDALSNFSFNVDPKAVIIGLGILGVIAFASIVVFASLC